MKTLFAILIILLTPSLAHAYLAPLLGLTGLVSSGVGLVLLTVLSVLMVFGKPIYRLIKKKKSEVSSEEEKESSSKNNNE